MSSRLNLFAGSEGNGAPDEHNLVRALVLCLRSSPLMLKSFLEKVVPADVLSLDTLGFLDLPSPSFRLRAGSAATPPARAVVGAALVDGELGAKRPAHLPRPKGEAAPQAVVQFGEQLAVVVATGHDGAVDWAQVAGHLARVPAPEGEAPRRGHGLVTWQEIAALASSLLRFLHNEPFQQGAGGHEARLASDFLDYLEEFHPRLAPGRTLAEIPAGADDPRVARRVFRLLKALGMGEPEWHQSYAYKVEAPAGVKTLRNLFLLTPRDEEPLDHSLTLCGYAGDTVQQARALWSNGKGVSAALTALRAEPVPGARLRVRPYVKLAYRGRALATHWQRLSEAELGAWLQGKDFFKLLGRQARRDWPAMNKALGRLGLATEEGDAEFQKGFARSKRTWADLSIGLYVGFSLPFARARELDGEGRLVPLLGQAAGKLLRTLGGL